ncbi:hypothetical protein GTQ40_04205 [Flavobacteriaceae bacterium R38]|nr:hypothetical protein [Flavobacteriaceae bacterium R38]
MKNLEKFLFLYPLVFNGLNLQGWFSLYLTETISKISAYFNIILIFIGIVLLIRNPKEYSSTAKMWIVFYIVYYSISIVASIIYDNELEVLKTIISIIFFFGFYSFLRFPDNRRLYEIVICSIFFVANVALVILSYYNLDYDFYDVDLEFKLDRAQGVYGDANNSALVCILGVIFINRVYIAKTLVHKILKIAAMAISAYALFLTFSTTGLGLFCVVILLLNYKLFTKKGILILIIVFPIFYLALLNLDTLTSGLNLNIRQQNKIQNVVNIVSLDFENVDSSGRDTLIENVIDNLYARPFFGNGLEFGIKHSTHNTFLNVWLDAGIFCLLIFLSLLLRYFKRAAAMDIRQKYFIFAILITLCGFMLSLQSVINQPYLITVFVYMAYIMDFEKRKELIVE